MSAIIVLIFIGIIVAGGFLAAFIWAVKSGQYDDDYSPSVRMLFDSKSKKVEKSNSRKVEQSNNQKVEDETDTRN
jgi:cbb3-type cytochrome oxidase maturation protein